MSVPSVIPLPSLECGQYFPPKFKEIINTKESASLDQASLGDQAQLKRWWNEGAEKQCEGVPPSG